MSIYTFIFACFAFCFCVYALIIAQRNIKQKPEMGLVIIYGVPAVLITGTVIIFQIIKYLEFYE